jgi:hypothetical protein
LNAKPFTLPNLRPQRRLRVKAECFFGPEVCLIGYSTEFTVGKDEKAGFAPAILSIVADCG